MESLKIKTARNLGIVYGANLATKIFGMIATIILARLLLPQDFGLVALSGIIIAIVLLFQDFGLGAALIQRQRDIEEATNVVFYSTIFIKSLLYLMVFAAAPLAAGFFNEPILTEIIRIAGLSLIIEAFAAGHSSLLLKNMEFKKLMGINVASSVFSSIVSIILAFLGFSFWSLVYGTLAASPLRVILYWYASSWRPKLLFDTKVAREMLEFGGWVMFINILTFFMYNTDGFFIGRFLNASSLGIYNMGMRWGLIGSDQIARVMNNVLFPTFSSIQREKERIQNAYLKALKYTNLLTIPLALGTIAIAPEFVTFILGEKWIEAILPLQIFAVYGLFFSIGTPAASVFLAVGEAKLAAKIMAGHLLFIIIFIYPFLLWGGIIGAALCVTLSTILMYFLIRTILVCSILDIKFFKSIKVLKAPTIASLIMFFSVMMAKTLMGSSLYTLFVFIFIGVVIYFPILYIMDREIFAEFKEILSAFKK